MGGRSRGATQRHLRLGCCERTSIDTALHCNALRSCIRIDLLSPRLDRCDSRVSCCRGLSCGSFYFGRRHLWYLIGTILVIVNFFFLFARCVMCDLTGDHQMNSDANLAYYAFAAALFNVGWAAVQVSHMALVPGTTKTQNSACTDSVMRRL
jgi:hypothetical protein